LEIVFSQSSLYQLSLRNRQDYIWIAAPSKIHLKPACSAPSIHLVIDIQ